MCECRSVRQCNVINPLPLLTLRLFPASNHSVSTSVTPILREYIDAKKHIDIGQQNRVTSLIALRRGTERRRMRFAHVKGGMRTKRETKQSSVSPTVSSRRVRMAHTPPPNKKLSRATSLDSPPEKTIFRIGELRKMFSCNYLTSLTKPYTSLTMIGDINYRNANSRVRINKRFSL